MQSNVQSIMPIVDPQDNPFIASIPGSKSYTNRAFVIAAQRMGKTYVRNALFSEDTELLANALDSFEGLSVNRKDDGFLIERTQSRLGAPRHEIHMGGAGTPARFLLAFASAVNGETVITGNARLCERPMVDLLGCLSSIGIRWEALDAADHLPVRVRGGAVGTDIWPINGAVSSQFTSALCLLAAQQPFGPIRIQIEGNQVSKPYVNMTLAMMNACGIAVRCDDERTIVVDPGEASTDTISVEVDASTMSYFLAAAAITNTTVEIPGISEHSAQGDVGFANALGRMGCGVEYANDAIRITGAKLHGIEVDMDTMPDVVLTLAAIAPLAETPTHIYNIANLRVKECDRINAAARELERLGVTVEERRDAMTIHPSVSIRPASIHTYDDHRVAMSFAILGLIFDGINIEDPDCVAKSFPNFWQEFERFRQHHGRLQQ